MRKIVIVFLMLVIVFIAFAPNTYGINNVGAANNVAPTSETSNNIDVTAKDDTKTMYYLNIPLKDKTIYLTDYDFLRRLGMPVTGDIPNNLVKKAEELSNIKQTFVFTYNNVTVNSYPVLTTWNIDVSVSRKGVFLGYILKFVFDEDIQINIRSEYYKLFENADFSDVSITFLYEGYGCLMRNDNGGGYWSYMSSGHNAINLSGSTLEQREVPIDYNPIEEEGQAPDNGGIVMNPVDNEDVFDLWKYVINAFKAVLNGTADIMQYITVVVAVIVGLFVLGLVIRLFTWIFGK